jgi:hypothetical protein
MRVPLIIDALFASLLLLVEGNNSMLAPFIIDALIASLLILAAGWVSDVLHASTHDDQSCCASRVGG